MCPDGLGVHRGKPAEEVVPRERQHPAGHGGVEDHQDGASGAEDARRDLPSVGIGMRQRFRRAVQRASARASDRQLHHHQRQTHHDQEEEVERHEARAAVFAGDERKTPDITEADGAACREEDEPDAGTERFAIGGHDAEPFGGCFFEGGGGEPDGDRTLRKFVSK